jgi:hypothetical protein
MIILHCSDSNYGNAATITEWHLQRGFEHIGYHYVILNGWVYNNYYDELFNGQIETGRHTDKKGAHCKGHNDSIGICLIGESGEFTPNQMYSLYLLLKNMEKKGPIYQHSDFDDKKSFCAGLDIDKIKKDINVHG